MISSLLSILVVILSAAVNRKIKIKISQMIGEFVIHIIRGVEVGNFRV